MFSLIIRGRNSPELQKWRDLRASLNFLQNPSPFSSASAAADASLQDSQKGNTFTVSYLVESLGFTTKLAESIFRRVTTSEETKSNPDSVLSLLRSHGFTDPHISTIVRTYPRLLLQDAESSLAPKLRFLTSRGASTSELTEILSKVPKILGIKKDKALSRYYDFVREILAAGDKSSSEFEGSPQENKLRNVLVLRDVGVPQRLLLPLLISNHHVCCGKEKFEETLKKVVEMGFEPSTFRFVEALRMLYQLSDKTIQEKLCFYEKLGFSAGEVWEMFKKNPSFLPLSEKNILNSMEAYLGLGFSRDEFAMLVKCHPQCLNYSVELVKRKTEFLVKTMNWPVRALVSNPTVLGYNLEKRTIPRCNVIKALMDRGLLGGGEGELPSLGSVLVCTDRAFLKRYVLKHDDDKTLVADLMDIFTGDRVS